LELIVDSYEQAIERPSDNQVQKQYYSGKKKKHTKKSQVTVLPKGTDIVDVDTGYPGTKSDINLFRQNQEKFHAEQKFSGDKGYVGCPAIKTPKKKPKKKLLTPLEIENNRELSSERIFVEHVIRLLKIFRVVQERFRLNSEKYESIVRTVCGLVRLIIGALVL
jgi:hypothetical protein